MSIEKQDATSLLDELLAMKMSDAQRQKIRALVAAVRAETTAEVEARCTPEGFRETAARSLEMAVRLGYLTAVRDIGDETGQHCYTARDAAVAEVTRLAEIQAQSPIETAAREARVLMDGALLRYQHELAAHVPSRFMRGVQPLAALAALHDTAKKER